MKLNDLKELLEIQAGFDSRIDTLNLEDSKTAYIIEFFEWFNTVETFKNWKKHPGKPLDVQLDELSDMLAFGLSIANQGGVELKDFEAAMQHVTNEHHYQRNQTIYSFMDDMLTFESDMDATSTVILPLNIAHNMYSIDQLIEAYKQKMKHNHARQDGTVDQDKGYV